MKKNRRQPGSSDAFSKHQQFVKNCALLGETKKQVNKVKSRNIFNF